VEADLHAIALISLPCVTALASWLFYLERPSAWRIAIGIAAALAAWFLQPSYFHACHEGLPFTQKLIPVLCLAPALIFIGRPLAAAAAGLVLFALAPTLCHQYLGLIHRDWCTGNPEWASKLNEAGSTYLLQGMGNALKRIGSLDPNPRPAGWLRDSDLWPLLYEDERECGRGPRIEVKRFWHTWITRLYSERQVEQAIWYPGGPPLAAAGRLALRDLSGTGPPR
jgi:hypothetical protein